jgi:uncharacterized membrane protein YeaQ/YmgE (transglycosylase-associated protein family)
MGDLPNRKASAGIPISRAKRKTKAICSAVGIRALGSPERILAATVALMNSGGTHWCLGLPELYSSDQSRGREQANGVIWTIIIGFLAGVIARFLMPVKNEPSGFILTTLLGVVGAFVATYLGQALGWYRADEGAGLIGAVVGAVIVLAIWGFIARSRSSV